MCRTSVTLAVSGVLSVSSAFAPVARAGVANSTGINVDYLYDSDNTPLLADAMRTYRNANTIGSAYNANNAVLDDDGWSTTDAWYYLGDPAATKHGDGTYAVRFTGQATIGVGSVGNNGGSVVSQSYDAASNTTTAYVQTRTGVDLSQIYFTNTQRTATSGTNTGVTDLQIMRPTTPGGATPYSFDSTFTNQTKTIAGKVGVLRFMDYLATNNNLQTSWSDRVLPTTVKLNPTAPNSTRGKGGPLELAVQLGNETGKDIWINIPALANDDYVTKVAQLIKFGSDGVNPYTSPQANPVYKPLSPNLHVYVEYSNETWNSSFKQYTQVQALAQSEKASEATAAGPLNYTAANGVSTDTLNVDYLGERYNALRTKQIADTFAGVFGSSAMLNTVRPILSWQGGNGTDTANQAQIVLDGYFNDTKGNFVTTPTAMNKYIYGGGSTNYYSPTTPTASLTVDAIVTEPANQTAAKIRAIAKDVAYATTFGIKRVAYEGGLSLDPGTAKETTDSLAAKYAALADPRMEQLIVQNHNTWTNEGGDLLVYYFSTDQYKFAFSNDTFDTNTPKLNGLTDLQNSDRTTNYSVGTALSRTAATAIDGGNFSIKDTAGSAFVGALTLKATQWSSYLINIPTSGEFTLTAHFETYGAVGSFQLILGGAVLADLVGLSSEGKYAVTPGMQLTLPQGITSLRVLMDLTSGTISLKDITFTPTGVNTIPEPAALALLATSGLALRRRRGSR